VEVAESIEPLL